MKKIIPLTLILFAFCAISCNNPSQRVFTADELGVIPKPNELLLGEGSFNLNTRTRLFAADNPLLKDNLSFWAAQIREKTGFKLKTTASLPTSNYIFFEFDESLEPEAYRIQSTPGHITISANDLGGFTYALQTLFQLLPPDTKNSITSDEIRLPVVRINDGPRFSHRGLMLDLSRHFFDQEYLKNTIDRMAMHKLNVLHLHLVDDQGWRMEIKKYPRLTAVGAWRVDQEEAPWNGRKTNDPNEKGTYGGFLTQEQLKELVAYAEQLNIEIIPEIEMPAHVSSAIAAYPELACFDQKIAVPSGGIWPITDIYCAGKETTFEFLENVLNEVMEVFPSTYIHIGGDEATKTNWKKCPHCQKRIASEGLQDEEELQSYFIKRIERYLNSKGKNLIGWDEILEGGLAPEATVMSWRGFDGGLRAAEEGHDVIMTPESYCYFNFYQGPQDVEPLAFNAFLPLSKVYEFEPVPEGLTPSAQKHILGGQANLWSEYITDTQTSEYMLYPRLAAMAEVLWSKKEDRNWNDFATRLEKQLERYNAMGINFSKSAFLVTAKALANIDEKQVLLSLENELTHTDIRYVLGEADLNQEAIPYHKPIALSKTTIVTASLFSDNQPIGRTWVDTITFHKAFGKPITFTNPYSKSYEGDGSKTLTNVVRGSKNFHDGQWQGWIPHDMEAVINLEQPQEVSKVVLGALENQGAGIFFPTEVSVWSSVDGKKFTKMGTYTRPFKVNSNADLIDMTIEFNATKTQYLKVVAKNLRDAPTGSGTWLFVDEIAVY